MAHWLTPKHLPRLGRMALWLAAALLGWPAAPADAGPLPVLDPRVLGMGGASVATAAGARAVPYDPSGLAGATFEVGFAGGWAPSDPAADPATWLRQLQSALDGSEHLPATDGQVAGSAAVVTQGSAVALWAEADVASTGMERRGELRSVMAFATGRPFRLRRLEAAWGAAVKLRYDRAFVEPQGGSPATREEAQGFSVDLGGRLSPWPWLTVGAVLYDVAGTLLVRSPSGQSPARTEQWLGSPRSWAAGVAVGPPGAPLRGAAEVRSGGGWSAGLEQTLFGGAVAVRLGHLVDAPGRAFNTVGLGLCIDPLCIDLAAALPAAGQPPAATTRLAFRF